MARPCPCVDVATPPLPLARAFSFSFVRLLQADTYRRMRKATRGQWAGFHPATNALWVAYLADTLLEKKASTGGR